MDALAMASEFLSVEVVWSTGGRVSHVYPLARFSPPPHPSLSSTCTAQPGSSSLVGHKPPGAHRSFLAPNCLRTHLGAASAFLSWVQLGGKVPTANI